MEVTGEFDGKVVLVSGAGRGVGRAIAEAFAQRGACVAASDLTPINLDEIMARIRNQGGKVRDYVFDTAKKMPVQSMVQQIEDDWGRIDILVNCNQVAPRATLLGMDEWDWHRTIDSNLGSVFLLMQVVGRVMQKQGGGSIVNVVVAAQEEGQVATLASQAGVLELTRIAARELDDYNIRVNGVYLSALQGHDEPVISFTPMQKHLSGQGEGPLEAVPTVLYLCDQAVEITGQVIQVEK